ncbi:MAG: caspase family protein, partial [Myxococcota bacterium]
MNLVLLLALLASAESERYVLSVGANVGTDNDEDLEYAEDDARRFVEVMARFGGAKAPRVRLLLGRDALGLEEAVNALADQIVSDGASNATVFFYFSGHADRRAIHVHGERFDLEQIEDWLAGVPAQLRVSVVDACRSAVDVRLKGFSTTDSFAIQLEPASRVQGLITMRSAADGEASQESRSLEGAVFTHYLLNALRGAADDDGDERVTLDEAYRYAYRQTVRRSSMSSAEVMHPSVEIEIEGAGQLVLTETSVATTRLRLPAGRDVRYVVFKRPQSSVIAELWSHPKRAVEVALAPGEYLVHRVDGEQ